MAPIPEPNNTAESSGGVYDVTESGIEYRHIPSTTSLPKDGSEFLHRLSANIQLRILDRPSPNELVFELLGVDVSFANALRRIMISEIPTMAIETIYMWNNTSLIHDEVLSHRLGMIPINVDPRLFDEYGLEIDENTGEHAATDRNTIVFRLNVTCGKDCVDDERLRKKIDTRLRGEGLISGYDVAKAQQQEQQQRRGTTTTTTGHDNDDETVEQLLEPSVMNLSVADDAASSAVETSNTPLSTPIDSPHRPFTRHVYARDLLWAPQGDQLTRFPLNSSGVGSGTGGGIRPIHEDILIAKMRPGQTIELEAHARKGIGKDHAKFSPVATASYRLMPQIEIVKPIYDDLADELVNWFEPGVFITVPIDDDDYDGSGDDIGHRCKAVVSNPYACTMSRNYMRNPILKESIKMTRVANHFIFHIESVGMLEPGVIVAEAIRILKEKCERVSGLADEVMTD
jgi:DNA-directed RNA polymerase I and III subunit RPAC1